MDSSHPSVLIDTHCHLDFPEYDPDREAVVARAAEAGVGCIINVGSDLENSRRAVSVAASFPRVYATVGFHPHEADALGEDTVLALRELAAKPKVVAIGEIGLDYYRNLSSPENQRKGFIAMIRLGLERKLPLVIHSRQAEADTVAILKSEGVTRAIIHCFSGDEHFLDACLGLGYMISFTCNVTYKKSDVLRRVAALVPSDRLCLETDAPYLSPEGYRGKRNEPSFVRLLCRTIAGLRGVSEAELAALTTANACRFFGLPDLTGAR